MILAENKVKWSRAGPIVPAGTKWSRGSGTRFFRFKYYLSERLLPIERLLNAANFYVDFTLLLCRLLYGRIAASSQSSPSSPACSVAVK
jgi:hypothetical protein